MQLGFGLQREDTSQTEARPPWRKYPEFLATLCPMAEVGEPKWSPQGLNVVENAGELGHKQRDTAESQIGGPLERSGEGDCGS